MKSKRLKRKLALNKNTVANLNGGQMHGVHGGGLVDTLNCLPSVVFVCELTCNCALTEICVPTSAGIACQQTCGCTVNPTCDCPTSLGIECEYTCACPTSVGVVCRETC